MNAEASGSAQDESPLAVPVPRRCLIIRAAGTRGWEIQANIGERVVANFPSRLLHDLGLAAWFGGTLANAVALNRAAGQASDPSSAGRVANTGWDAWTPINAVAIGAHIVGSVGQLLGNKERLATQSGVASMSVIKTALTAAALGITGYSTVLGRKVSQETRVPVSSGTEPSAATPPDVAGAQTQLKLLQWAVPAITGALVGVSAYAGEQQRPVVVEAGEQQRPVVVEAGEQQRPVVVEAGEQQRPVVVEAGMLKKLTRRGK
jgi:hypothetical protein